MRSDNRLKVCFPNKQTEASVAGLPAGDWWFRVQLATPWRTGTRPGLQAAGVMVPGESLV